MYIFINGKIIYNIIIYATVLYMILSLDFSKSDKISSLNDYVQSMEYLNMIFAAIFINICASVIYGFIAMSFTDKYLYEFLIIGFFNGLIILFLFENIHAMILTNYIITFIGILLLYKDSKDIWLAITSLAVVYSLNHFINLAYFNA